MGKQTSELEGWVEDRGRSIQEGKARLQAEKGGQRTVASLSGTPG